MKRKDAKIKEAQGRVSIAEGERNKARVLSTLMKRPLTFLELKKKVGLSSPVLTKHLRLLSKEGLIQKTLARDDRVVYQVISQKKAIGILGALFSAIFFYVVGRKLSAETMDSIRRDLEKVVSTEDSESFEEELENWEESKKIDDAKILTD